MGSRSGSKGDSLIISAIPEATGKMKFKTLFPFIAALGVYFFALNSPMQIQMNQNHLTDKEIKVIPVERFKPNEGI